ncbi:MAG: hypothetical protein QM722_19990 [Piscinibacter sp.]
MNRHSPSPAVVWPYRPHHTPLAATAPADPMLPSLDEGFDDVAARLAGPGRDLQQTMTAMVRVAVAQDRLTH